MRFGPSHLPKLYQNKRISVLKKRPRNINNVNWARRFEHFPKQIALVQKSTGSASQQSSNSGTNSRFCSQYDFRAKSPISAFSWVHEILSRSEKDKNVGTRTPLSFRILPDDASMNSNIQFRSPSREEDIDGENALSTVHRIAQQNKLRHISSKQLYHCIKCGYVHEMFPKQIRDSGYGSNEKSKKLFLRSSQHTSGSSALKTRQKCPKCQTCISPQMLNVRGRAK